MEIAFTRNLYYTINGFFDRDNDTKFNNSIYFRFDKLAYFSFPNSCIIKNYFIDIHQTEQPNVYDQHDVVIYVRKYDINNNAQSTLLRIIRKSHPNRRHYSYGDLQINMPNYSAIQIAIGKNYNGSRFDKASIKYARLALTIEI